MKKLIAIGLLCLFTYHLLRHHAAEWLVWHCHNHVLPQYSGQKVVIKLPVSLPYTAEWQSDGNHQLIRNRNEFYNIVEQRYENDTLYTVLQSNQAAREQFFALADMVQQETEAPSPVSSALKLLKNLSDYYFFASLSVIEVIFYTSSTIQTAGYVGVCYCSPVSSIPTPPPQAA
ncbi:hypothetical protein [Rhodoflexus caldus]|uniref:hypothetical protein n=1 Tax=Rhodoflexus caldus TaxID=2891236 RepID=UPI00202A1D83|nr:hypothetical protein [Rhodoflexus caldus]